MIRSFLLVVLLAATVVPVAAQDGDGKQRAQDAGQRLVIDSRTAMTTSSAACDRGFADIYPCENVDLRGHISVIGLGAAPGIELNDIWGWTDPETDRRYVIVGREDGMAIAEVTDPDRPQFLVNINRPADSFPNTWADMKVYGHYVYMVADNAGDHGMQIFDLTRLRSLETTPVTLEPDARYTGFREAHNIVINEETGFAYAVGTELCGGGLHIVDLSEPLAPVEVGCFADIGTGRRGTGYTHDAQCVVYAGPDEEHAGKELCFASNETHVSILDVTDKNAPEMISRSTYPTAGYIHQGWLNDDQTLFVQNDELDELEGRVGITSTYIWDVSDLDDPVLIDTYAADYAVIDHNLYVHGRYALLSNYEAGLRILDLTAEGGPAQVAFFDTYPFGNQISFNGAWSHYLFEETGMVAVSSRGEGLFIVQPIVDGILNDSRIAREELPSTLEIGAAYPNPTTAGATVEITLEAPAEARVRVYDVLGRHVADVLDARLMAGTTSVAVDLSAQTPGTYLVRVEAGGAARTLPLVRVP